MAVSRRPKVALNGLGILPWDCLKIRFGAFWHLAFNGQGGAACWHIDLPQRVLFLAVIFWEIAAWGLGFLH
jgi:hypothetical protein